MNTPWYKKKKIWAAVLAGIAVTVAQITGETKLAELITAIGMMLLGALWVIRCIFFSGGG